MDENQTSPDEEAVGEASEEVLYTNPVAAEITRRNAEIRAMKGSRLKQDMDELEITIGDYSSDFQIVFDHFCRYLLGKDNMSAFNQEGTRQWKRKSSGLLRNFLVSRMALRDHTYVLVKRYWEADPSVPREEDVEFMDAYRAKVKELLVKPEFAFLQDLRNYGVHKALYPFVLNTKFAGNYMKNDITLDGEELLANYDSWSSQGRKYLLAQGDRVDLLGPMEEWSKACRQFYQWFHAAVTTRHADDVAAVNAAIDEHNKWMRESGAMPPDWFLRGEEPPGSAPRPMRRTSNANKKRKRKQRKRR